GLPFGSGLPSAVHPEPLIGITAHELLNYLIESRSIQIYIFFHVSRINDLYFRLEVQPVFVSLLVPDDESRHNRCPSAKGQCRKPRRRTGRYAEEVAEDTLIPHRIEVYQYPHCFASSQRREYGPRR